MKYKVSVSFEVEVETGSHPEALTRALERIRAGLVEPDYVSVYVDREKSE